ncbi:nicotinate-nucleotide--dimethylbenzimidazole phosphoribosyltransferase [Anaeromicropila populeti]|uniref:Nicotinate-nucleotide--dimethylbenzimidazole phosphoribosyltransferase n=1 Tax=Anaeromicropila populeti TaxID=37658 RepID=A0A1I6J0R6_9FIRM|nr:nicotinate-nucleotide--dimethylbenzimidazole phosphoribosyltransferase [Anaeromicropila populeti]SFR72602.1 nicotinate-nucleotide-dimethylbenzimidazole phosphoribosyltransferase [Anaeromicropila populeti]
MKLNEIIKKIEPLDELAKQNCRKRWDSIAKPLYSLGKLEEVIVQISGITKSHKVKLDKRALVIMCADNGVVEEGVTQVGSEITAIVSENFMDMNSCVCVMAQQAAVDVYPIDIGIMRDTKVPNRKVAYGTKNIRYEPAMTREQAVQAIEVGIETVFELKEKGYHILATGEMGIGNTTTSSAVSSVLLELSPEVVTGKGAGLSDTGLEKKRKVIAEAIELHKPDKNDPIDVLAKVGGFDIAGLAGVYLGAAAAKIPVVMDGFISAAAALAAVGIEPEVIHYIIPSHVSKESGGKRLLDALGKEPFLTCDMCLGEGTGAVALFPLLDMALEVYLKMSTFEEIEIEAYQPL